MSIDADPTNGTRPCDPIDPAATVPPNTSHAIAVCLSHYLASFGSPPAFEARVGYSTLETAPEVADVAPALDDNPDANDGAGPNGIGASGWDCTAFGTAFPKGEEPFSPERDAFIFCSTSVVKGALTAEPGLLATVTLQSGAVGGIETLSVLGDSNIYGKNCEPIDALVCTGATITIDPGAPPLLSH